MEVSFTNTVLNVVIEDDTGPAFVIEVNAPPVVVPGGGGSGPAGAAAIYIASVVSGTNLVALTVPGAVLSATEILIWFRPVAANTGPVALAVNGGALVPLIGRLQVPLGADEMIVGVPVLIGITLTQAQIFVSV